MYFYCIYFMYINIFFKSNLYVSCPGQVKAFVCCLLKAI